MNQSILKYVFVTSNDKFDDSFSDMIKFIQEKGKRAIPQQEIVVAIILACRDKDCNPDFNRTEMLLSTTELLVPTQSVIAPDSESVPKQVTTSDVDVKNKVTVSETELQVVKTENMLSPIESFVPETICSAAVEASGSNTVVPETLPGSEFATLIPQKSCGVKREADGIVEINTTVKKIRCERKKYDENPFGQFRYLFNFYTPIIHFHIVETI